MRACTPTPCPLPPHIAAYDRVRELPGVKAWIDEALAEKTFWTLKNPTGGALRSPWGAPCSSALRKLFAQKRLPGNVRQLRRGHGAAQVFVFDIEHLVGARPGRATTSCSLTPCWAVSKSIATRRMARCDSIHIAPKESHAAAAPFGLVVPAGISVSGWPEFPATAPPGPAAFHCASRCSARQRRWRQRARRYAGHGQHLPSGFFGLGDGEEEAMDMADRTIKALLPATAAGWARLYKLGLMQIYMVGGAVVTAFWAAVNDHDWVVVGATPEQMLELGCCPWAAIFRCFAPRNARNTRWPAPSARAGGATGALWWRARPTSHWKKTSPGATSLSIHS